MAFICILPSFVAFVICVDSADVAGALGSVLLARQLVRLRQQRGERIALGCQIL